MTEKEEEKIIKLLEEKNYQEAIKICNEILNTNNEDEIAYFYRGSSKYYLKEYKGAIEDFNKVIDSNGYHKDAHYNRGLCKSCFAQYKEDKEASKYFEEALDDFNKFIKLEPKQKDFPAYYYNRYVPKYYLEQYDGALDDFNKFIELAKKDININFIINAFINIMKISDIKEIFTKLIQTNYNELFVNAPTFELLKNKIESKDISNKDDIFNNIKEILFYQYLLLKSLSFNINDNIEISHYTSLNTLLLLLNDKKEYKNKEKDKNKKEDKENKEDEGKIRIVNISNANDPKEGKILESIFNKNGLDIKISDNEENLITLQTSFSRNKDSLTMFRLYGKNENKEATGVCLVIDKKYFNDKYFSPPIQISSILSDDKKLDNKEEQIDNLKQNLFWILYYNEKENKLIFNPKYSKYKNIIIELDNIEELKNKYKDKKDKIILNNKKEIIEYIFSNIYYYAKELNKEIKDKNLKNEIFSNLFENIKYIIKDEAFFKEQELRMLITTDYKNEKIKEDKKRLYINYIKLFDENSNYINEIILGAKIEDKELMADYIKQIVYKKYKDNDKMNKIKVSISKAPLR